MKFLFPRKSSVAALPFPKQQDCGFAVTFITMSKFRFFGIHRLLKSRNSTSTHNKVVGLLISGLMITPPRCSMDFPLEGHLPNQGFSSFVPKWGKLAAGAMISWRLYCTTNDCGVAHCEVVGNDVDRVYKVVMDRSYAYQNMEESLDGIGVSLTTPLVVDVLNRLRYEEKIAFRFFNWAGRREGYEHETEAYNMMIDILTSTKYKAKQFRIMCDMLDYMKRRDAKRVPVDVLLQILKQYTEKYLTHVQKFAKKKKIRVKTQPEINAFNLLLDSLCKCGLVDDAEDLFKRVKSKIKPDSNTYNVLFFGWCRVRKPTKAMKVLEDMIEMGLTPDSFTYITAIDSFCKAGMVDEAVELFEFMRTKGSTLSSPTAKTYVMMAVALVKNDRMEESFKLLGDMKQCGCLPDVSTYKELIAGMCVAGKIEEAYKILEEMGNEGYPPDILTYNCFLKVLCDNGNIDEAVRFYGRMIEVGCMPSVQTFNMLISMFFPMNDLEGAFETWHEMEKRGCLRDADTYCVMIEGLFKCKRADDACLLLEDVMNQGMKLPYRKFDSFLMELSTTGDLKTIHRLSEHMRKFYNPAIARRFALNQKRLSISLRRT